MHLLIILVFMASLCGFHVILVSGLTLGNPGVFSRGVLLSLASSLLDEPARWKTFLQTSPRCPLELRIKQEIRARSFTWKGFKRQAHRLCGGPHGLLSTLLALVSHRVLVVTPELVLHLYLRVCENKAQSGRRQSSLHATSVSFFLTPKRIFFFFIYFFFLPWLYYCMLGREPSLCYMDRDLNNKIVCSLVLPVFFSVFKSLCACVKEREKERKRKCIMPSFVWAKSSGTERTPHGQPNQCVYPMHFISQPFFV